MDVVVGTVCEAPPDVQDRILSMKEQCGKALIIKCDPKKRKVVIDDELEDAGLSDIREEIPETSPRYVLFWYQRFLLCIFFNPLDCHPDAKRMYQSTKDVILHLFEVEPKFVEISRPEDFEGDFINMKVFGVKGKVGKHTLNFGDELPSRAGSEIGPGAYTFLK